MHIYLLYILLHLDIYAIAYIHTYISTYIHTYSQTCTNTHILSSCAQSHDMNIFLKNDPTSAYVSNRGMASPYTESHSKSSPCNEIFVRTAENAGIPWRERCTKLMEAKEVRAEKERIENVDIEYPSCEWCDYNEIKETIVFLRYDEQTHRTTRKGLYGNHMCWIRQVWEVTEMVCVSLIFHNSHQYVL